MAAAHVSESPQMPKKKKNLPRFLSLGLLRLHPAKPFINADEIPSPPSDLVPQTCKYS